MRRAGFLLSVVALVAAAAVVPLPWLAITPGPTFETSELIDVSGDVADANGHYLLTSVQLDDASLFETIGAVFDDATDLVERSSAIPTDIGEDEFIRAQRRLFEETARLAWAVGTRAAGWHVRIQGGGAEVLAIADGVPADEVFQAGDVIVAIDGAAVTFAADVSNMLAAHAAGDEVTVTFGRDDAQLTDEVELIGLARTDEAGFGALLRTMNRVIEMPVIVDVLLSRSRGLRAV